MTEKNDVIEMNKEDNAEEKFRELNEQYQKVIGERDQAHLQSKILLEAAKKQAERLSNALFDMDLALVQLNMIQQEKQPN